MNWVYQLLQQALKTCPKGGRALEVLYPSDGRALSEQTMREQLLAAANKERGEVERMLSTWASTGSWPRSSRYSGWILRQILRAAAEIEDAAWYNKMAQIQGPDESARKAAVLTACANAWFQVSLPEWAETEAQLQHSVQKLFLGGNEEY